MDRKRLIGEVAARHGIRLEEDDPAFLLVTLTDLMLREAQDQFDAAAQKAIAEYEDAAARVQERTGQALAAALRDTLRREVHPFLKPNSEIAAPLAVTSRFQEHLRSHRWMALGLFCGLGLFLVGLVTGRMFFS